MTGAVGNKSRANLVTSAFREVVPGDRKAATAITCFPRPPRELDGVSDAERRYYINAVRDWWAFFEPLLIEHGAIEPERGERRYAYQEANHE